MITKVSLDEDTNSINHPLFQHQKSKRSSWIEYGFKETHVIRELQHLEEIDDDRTQRKKQIEYCAKGT